MWDIINRDMSSFIEEIWCWYRKTRIRNITKRIWA
jgi:hypothetical protein